MPTKPTTVPQLDTNSTNRTIPAPSKVTDGFVLNDILPAANVNYLWGWMGDWLGWLDSTFSDGAAPGDLALLGGNLGIGTASPAYKLTVDASGVDGIFLRDPSQTSGAPQFIARGNRYDNNVAQGFSGKYVMERWRSERVGVDPAGGVPIQTGLPLGALIWGGNHTNGAEANIAYTASIQARAEAAFADINTMPTSLVFYTGATGEPITTTSTIGDEGMRLDSQGRLGIGITAATAHLHVKAPNLGGTAADEEEVFTAQCNSADPDRLRTRLYRHTTDASPTWDTARWLIQRRVSATEMGYIGFGNNASDLLTFGEGNTEYMRLDGGGRLGIGVQPLTRLHVWQGVSGQTPQSSTLLCLEDDDDVFISFLTPNTSTAGLWFGTPGDRDAGRLVYLHNGASADEMRFFVQAQQTLTVNNTDGIIVAGPVKSTTSKTIPCLFLDATPQATGFTSLTRSSTTGYISFYDSSTSRIYKTQPMPHSGTVTAAAVRLRGQAAHQFRAKLYKRDYTTGDSGSLTLIAQADYSASGLNITATEGTVVSLTVSSGSVGANDSVIWEIENLETTASALIVYPGSITMTVDDVTLTK